MCTFMHIKLISQCMLMHVEIMICVSLHIEITVMYSHVCVGLDVFLSCVGTCVEIMLCAAGWSFFEISFDTHIQLNFIHLSLYLMSFHFSTLQGANIFTNKTWRLFGKEETKRESVKPLSHSCPLANIKKKVWNIWCLHKNETLEHQSYAGNDFYRRGWLWV